MDMIHMVFFLKNLNFKGKGFILFQKNQSYISYIPNPCHSFSIFAFPSIAYICLSYHINWSSAFKYTIKPLQIKHSYGIIQKP